jgi:hypothetical protein
MWGWVDHFGGLVFDAIVPAALLLSAVAMAMLACRQPARRVVLARAGILCVLGLIPLLIVKPVPRLDVVASLQYVDVLPRFGEPTPADPTVRPPETDVARAAHPLASRHRWLLLLGRGATLVYIVGVAANGAWFLLGCWGSAWIKRRSSPPSPTSLALYQALPFAGRGHRPALQVSGRVGRPVLVGTVWQSILIPGELDLGDAAGNLRLSLLHELAHSEAGDPWFSTAGAVAQVAWFVLPPLWWIRAQLRLDHEFLADRRAAGEFGPPRNYASSLLDLAGPSPSPSGASARGSADAADERPVSALFLRMLMLLRCPFPVESRPPAWWTWVASLSVAAVTLAVSSLWFRVPDPSSSLARADDLSAKPGTRTFRVARVAIPERASTPQGRAPRFDVPFELPAEFDLTLEVWCSDRSLAQTRVVGLRLGGCGVPGQSPDPDDRWHLVRVRRERAGVVLWVDGNPGKPAEGDRTTQWLSVEPPPDRPAQFRNLVVRW